MSIMYCNEHDMHWDSDLFKDCPICDDEKTELHFTERKARCMSCGKIIGAGEGARHLRTMGRQSNIIPLRLGPCKPSRLRRPGQVVEFATAVAERTARRENKGRLKKDCQGETVRETPRPAPDKPAD